MLNYPGNTIWYVQSSAQNGLDLSEGSAVAIRLRKKDGPAKTYLLTCSHVVGGKLGGTRKIHAWPPNVGYNEKQRIEVKVEAGIGDRPDDKLNVADDWVVLQIHDEQLSLAAPAVKNWAGEDFSGNFGIWGYMGGEDSFPQDIVIPKRTPDTFPFDHAWSGAVYFGGQGTRPGISGGGVFGEADTLFAGIHRARFDATQQLCAVSSSHICRNLSELDYQIIPNVPLKRQISEAVAPPSRPPIDLTRFASEIHKQLMSIPKVIVRLEDNLKPFLDRLDIVIKPLQQSIGQSSEEVRANALVHILIDDLPFDEALEALAATIGTCTAESDEKEKQVLFTLLCWFLPARFKLHKSVEVRSLYEEGNVDLIKSEAATPLGAEIIMAAAGLRRVMLDHDLKGDWVGKNKAPDPSPPPLGKNFEEHQAEQIEKFALEKYAKGVSYSTPPTRASINRTIAKRKNTLGVLYLLLGGNEITRGMGQTELENLAETIRSEFPCLAVLQLSDEQEIINEDFDHFSSLREILQGS